MYYTTERGDYPNFNVRPPFKSEAEIADLSNRAAAYKTEHWRLLKQTFVVFAASLTAIGVAYVAPAAEAVRIGVDLLGSAAMIGIVGKTYNPKKEAHDMRIVIDDQIAENVCDRNAWAAYQELVSKRVHRACRETRIGILARADMMNKVARQPELVA